MISDEAKVGLTFLPVLVVWKRHQNLTVDVKTLFVNANEFSSHLRTISTTKPNS